MNTKGLYPFLILMLSFIFLTSGCSLNTLFLDESNLEKVVKYYYRPAFNKALSARESYHFLSEKSKAQISLDEWKKMTGVKDNFIQKSVRILGEKKVLENVYAIVSIKGELADKDVKFNKYEYTRTWILENGKWRCLRFPKLTQEGEKAFNSGDYTTAKARAEEWLDLDPYSVRAYDQLGNAIRRIGSSSSMAAGRSNDDIIRAMLAINPNDNAVLFTVVSWSDTPSIAKSYLKKLEGTSSYQEAAFNYTISIKGHISRLKFLDGLEITPCLAMLKLEAIAKLLHDGSPSYTWIDFKKVASAEGSFEYIKGYLDSKDSIFAASWAGKMGICFYHSKDKISARKWLEYGISRDPNDERFKVLAALLEGKN